MSDIAAPAGAPTIPAGIAVPAPAPAPAPTSSPFPDFASLIGSNPETLAAGVEQYAGDAASAVSGYIPAPVRAFIYPAALLIDAAVAIAYTDHLLSFTVAALVAGAVTSFSHGVAFSNVPRLTVRK